MRTVVVTVFFLFIHHATAMSDEEALKSKAELIESGLASEGFPLPCVNFPEYSAGRLHINYIKGRKLKTIREVMEKVEDTFAPFQQIKKLYAQCQSSPPLFRRRFVPGPNEAEAQQNRRRLQDFINNNEFVNVDLFADEYKYTLRILFVYGSTFFTESTLGRRVLIGRPDGKEFVKEDECELVAGKERCKEIANTVFGVQFKEDLPVVMYFPKNPEDRKALFQAIFNLYNSPELGWYSTCEEFTTEIFPIFFKKMYFDYIQTEQPIKDLEAGLKTIWTDILEQIDDTVRTLNVSENRRQEYMKHFHENTEFMSIEHPIFEKEMFERYFDFVDFKPVSELYQSRHLWSIRPIIRYNIDQRSSNFYTASLNKHATIFHEDQKRYIGQGFEAFTYPLYHKSFPPSITYSNYVFALSNEALSAIVYLAYSKRNELHRRKTQIQTSNTSRVNQLSEDQLYFVNLAQTIVLERAQYKLEPFSPNAKIWNLFKCFRGFSNAFRCRAGDNYYISEDCRILQPNLVANYSLSYFDYEDSVEKLLKL